MISCKECIHLLNPPLRWTTLASIIIFSISLSFCFLIFISSFPCVLASFWIHLCFNSSRFASDIPRTFLLYLVSIDYLMFLVLTLVKEVSSLVAGVSLDIPLYFSLTIFSFSPPMLLLISLRRSSLFGSYLWSSMFI